MPSITAPPPPSDTPAIAARIREVAGDDPAAIARQIRMPEATVRRQLAAPTLPFIVAVCAGFGVSANWLCLGEGRAREGVAQ